MAVLGHFEATIRVNGETAQEYDDENADQAQPATVVKYIEAISDAEFSMYFILRRTYESEFGLRIRASVDGQRVGGIMIQECYTSAARTGGDRAFQKAHSTSIRGGQEWKMPFKFLTVVTRLFLQLSAAFGVDIGSSNSNICRIILSVGTHCYREMPSQYWRNPNGSVAYQMETAPW